MRVRALLLGLGSVLSVASGASAHVGFSAPEPGAVLLPGELTRIAWSDVIVHDTVAYDLELLPPGASERQGILHDLPSDQQSYDWLVPEMSCAEGCLLIVTQKNLTGPYYDDALPITIAGAESDGASAGPEVGCGVSPARPSRAPGVLSGAVALALCGAFRRRRLLGARLH